jgi:hypothetical protein
MPDRRMITPGRAFGQSLEGFAGDISRIRRRGMWPGAVRSKQVVYNATTSSDVTIGPLDEFPDIYLQDQYGEVITDENGDPIYIYTTDLDEVASLILPRGRWVVNAQFDQQLTVNTGAAEEAFFATLLITYNAIDVEQTGGYSTGTITYGDTHGFTRSVLSPYPFVVSLQALANIDAFSTTSWYWGTASIVAFPG